MALRKFSLATQKTRRWSSPSLAMVVIAEVTGPKTCSGRISEKQRFKASASKENSVALSGLENFISLY
jgi:hypothetical protein